MIQVWVVYATIMGKYYDQMNDTPKDYAIEVDGLPRDIDDNSLDLNESLTHLFTTEKNLKVARVSLIYDSDDYTEKEALLNEKRSLLAKLTYKLQNKLLKLSEPGFFAKCFGAQSEETQINELQDTIRKTKQDCDNFEEIFNNGRDGKLFQGVAIVSFEHQKDKKDALARFYADKSLFACILNKITGNYQKELLVLNAKGKKYDLNVRDPPNPLDVLYANQKHQGYFRIVRWLISLLVLFVTFGLCFMGVFVVFMIGQNIKNHELEYRLKYDFLSKEWILSKASTVSISIGLVIFNTILDVVVNKVFEFRKYRNNTDMQVGIAAVSFKMQVLNSALCPIVSSFIAMNYMGSTGLIIEINAIFFAN